MQVSKAAISSVLWVGLSILTGCNGNNCNPWIPIYSDRGTFTDSRDNQQYPYVTIGAQTWMAKNLNYAKTGSCWQNLQANCTSQGRLYTWTQAANSSVCPTGWHVPSETDWMVLTNYLSDHPGRVFQQLASVSWGGGWNSAGFNAIPTGWYYINGFTLGVIDAAFWLSTEASSARGEYVLLSTVLGYQRTDDPKTQMFSVRCVKDD